MPGVVSVFPEGLYILATQVSVGAPSQTNQSDFIAEPIDTATGNYYLSRLPTHHSW